MDLEAIAIQRIKTASQMSLQHYKKPLLICISGGKDSAVLTDLAIRSQEPLEFAHNHTTADAPETVRFLRSEFSRLENLGYSCVINYPSYKGTRTSMWNLIPQKLMPPTRLVRYCCDILKENGGKGRFIGTGVRWSESRSRKNNRGIYEKLGSTPNNKIILANDNDETRRLFEHCTLKSKRVVNPIVDWETADVMDYISDRKLPMNPLYGEGFNRIGCIGCPLASKRFRQLEFSRWPAYRKLYINAFDKMLDMRFQRGKMEGSWKMGTTGLDVFNWWMEESVLPGQMTMEEFEE